MSDAPPPPSKRRLACGPYVYSLDDSLGRGTFAEVFKGWDPEGRVVAIKRIPKARLKKSENSQRLLKSEVKILRELRHQNIVQLINFQVTSEYICLVLEYCDGGDLGTYVERHSPMSEDLIALILFQLVAALRCLHDKDVVHRDLKPQNILLCGAALPVLKLADFGFARRLFSEDLAATFCGSPLYMAPEVLQGGNYNAKADLWSVGTIVFQCLTGRAPFRADNIDGLKALLRSNGARVSYPPGTSKELVDLLTGLLQPNPEFRLNFEDLFSHPFLERANNVPGAADLMAASLAAPPPAPPAAPTKEQPGVARGGLAVPPAAAASAAGAGPTSGAGPSPFPAFEATPPASPARRHFYGDAPRSPSPSTSFLSDGPGGSGGGGGGGLGSSQMSRSGSVTPGASSSVDRSYVLIDKQHVEINSWADAVQGRANATTTAQEPRWRGFRNLTGGARARAPSIPRAQIASFVRGVEEISRPPAEVMAVAEAHMHGLTSPPPGAGAEQHDLSRSAFRGRGRAEALVLFSKALHMIRACMSEVRQLLAEQTGVAFTPEGNDAIQYLRKKFNDCIARLETLRSLIPASDASLVVPSAEEMIYEYAMTLCRESARNEAENKNLETSEVLYKRALILITILVREAELSAEAADLHVLKDFQTEIARRFEGVRAQALGTLDPAASPRSRPSPPEHPHQQAHGHLHPDHSLGQAVAAAEQPHSPPSAQPYDPPRSSPLAAPSGGSAAPPSKPVMLLGGGSPGNSPPSTGTTPPAAAASTATPSPGLHCSQCGKKFGTATSRFCVHCGAPREGLSPSLTTSQSQGQSQLHGQAVGSSVASEALSFGALSPILTGPAVIPASTSPPATAQAPSSPSSASNPPPPPPSFPSLTPLLQDGPDILPATPPGAALSPPAPGLDASSGFAYHPALDTAPPAPAPQHAPEEAAPLAPLPQQPSSLEDSLPFA